MAKEFLSHSQFYFLFLGRFDAADKEQNFDDAIKQVKAEEN